MHRILASFPRLQLLLVVLVLQCGSSCASTQSEMGPPSDLEKVSDAKVTREPAEDEAEAVEDAPAPSTPAPLVGGAVPHGVWAAVSDDAVDGIIENMQLITIHPDGRLEMYIGRFEIATGVFDVSASSIIRGVWRAEGTTLQFVLAVNGREVRNDFSFLRNRDRMVLVNHEEEGNEVRFERVGAKLASWVQTDHWLTFNEGGFEVRHPVGWVVSTDPSAETVQTCWTVIAADTRKQVKFNLFSSEEVVKIQADPKALIASASIPEIVSPVVVELEPGARPFGVLIDAGIEVSGTLESGTAVTVTLFWVDDLNGRPVMVMVVLAGEDRLGEIDDILSMARFDES